MTSAEYSEIYQRTKVYSKNYPYIFAIKKLSDEGGRVSNSAIAEAVSLTVQAVGSTCTQMEKDGILENVSTHPLWRDWKLTPLGIDLYNAIAEKVVFTDLDGNVLARLKKAE